VGPHILNLEVSIRLDPTAALPPGKNPLLPFEMRLVEQQTWS
jgi:hypothetical protein